MANYDLARLDALNDIGTDGSQFDENLIGAEAACGAFVKRVAENVTAKDLVDTGKILDLTVQKVSDNSINIVGWNYIIFLDEGIQGAESNAKAPNSPFKMKKMPNPQTFADWIRRKNIRLENNPSYGGSTDEMVDSTQVDKVAYAMALTRYREGYEPQDIFAKEIEQLANDAAEGVADAQVNTILKGLDNL